MDERNLYLELTEKEQQAVREVAAKIDLNAANVTLYGAAAQRRASEFSVTALEAAEVETDEIGELIDTLMEKLRKLSLEETPQPMILRWLRKTDKNPDLLQRKRLEAVSCAEELAVQMERYQLSLRKDVEILKQLHEKNMDCGKMLDMYVLAGSMKLRRERETTLANLREIARRTELTHDDNAAREYEELCLRFERRLRELKSTEDICLQAGPLLRQLQAENMTLSHKLQSVILEAIPQWKQKMENFELLQMLEEVLQTQADRKDKRQLVRTELQRIVGELSQKLLEVR